MVVKRRNNIVIIVKRSDFVLSEQVTVFVRRYHHVMQRYHYK